MVAVLSRVVFIAFDAEFFCENGLARTVLAWPTDVGVAVVVCFCIGQQCSSNLYLVWQNTLLAQQTCKYNVYSIDLLCMQSVDGNFSCTCTI